VHRKRDPKLLTDSQPKNYTPQAAGALTVAKAQKIYGKAAQPSVSQSPDDRMDFDYQQMLINKNNKKPALLSRLAQFDSDQTQAHSQRVQADRKGKEKSKKTLYG